MKLWALCALGFGALVFDLTLSFRLPRESDWAEAAGALRARAQPGDALQPWPVWAEEARRYVDAMPVVIEEDLERADYFEVKRLWMLSLPRAPFAGGYAESLAKRGARPFGEPERFGVLALQAWDLHTPPLAARLTPDAGMHEVDYVARPCAPLRIGQRVSAIGEAGSALHVRAGIIGERAYDRDAPEVVLRAFADGLQLGEVRVPSTLRDGTGWHRLDVAMPPGMPQRQFTFSAESADAGRPFCVLAWTTR